MRVPGLATVEYGRTLALTVVLVSVLPSVAVLHTTVGGSTVWIYDV